MICKSCGSEGRGSVCPICGAALVNEAFAAEGQAPSAATKVVTPTAPRPVRGKKARARTAECRRRAFARGEEKIRFSQVLFAALALLLPLVYFFFDTFVIYADGTFLAGGSQFSLLIERLADEAYAYNPIADVIAATWDEAIGPPVTVSLLEALSLGGGYTVAAAVIAAAALFSALCGILVLLSFGRVLYSRLMTDFILLCGFLATAAPFLADFTLRLFAVDTPFTDARIHFAVEAALLALIFLCILPPAVRRLRREAGCGEQHVTLPYRVLGRCFGKRFLRVLGFLAAVGTVLCCALPLVLPVCGEAGLLTAFLSELSAVGADIELLAAVLKGGSVFAAIAALQRLSILLFLPLLLLLLVFSLLALLRILLVPSRRIAAKERERLRLFKVGKVLRRPLWLSFLFLLLMQVLCFLLLLLCSAVKLHLVPTDVGETLSLIYLLMLYIKSICGLSLVEAIFAAGVLALSVLAGNCARALVRLSLAEHAED